MSGMRDAPPYREDSFADREEPLRIIKSKIEQARSSDLKYPIIHFHGVPRIGKTWLMCHLAKLYRFSPVTASEKPTISILIPCANLHGTTVPLPAFASSIIQQLGEQQIMMPLGSLNSLDELARLVCSLSESYIPLLLLDAADTLPEEVFVSLERDFLVPVVTTDKIIVAVSGRKDSPDWTQFEIRRRLKYYELEPFKVDETGEQMRKAAFAADKWQIYHYTGGHPYASWKLGCNPSRLSNRDWVGKQLHPVVEHLLRNVKPEWKEFVRLMSVFRAFNIEPMRLLLSEVLAPQYAQMPGSYYLQLLEQSFADPDLLSLTRPGGYVLAPSVRCILKQHLLLVDPSKYRKAQETAGSLNEQWARGYKSSRFLEEMIYHRTEAWVAMGTTEQILQEAVNECVQMIAQEGFTLDEIIQLEHLLQDDTELQEIMPKSIYEALLQAVHDFRLGRPFVQ